MRVVELLIASFFIFSGFDAGASDVIFSSCLSPTRKNDDDSKIEQILSHMSIEEKIGQLNQLDGRTDLTKLSESIRRGEVSSIMNITDRTIVDSLQKIAIEESPSGIPIIFARDIVHGFKTVLPIPLGQAASFDPELVSKAARNTALEATECGIRWAFAPMMDIARDPRWGRIAESFGEDPYLSSKMAVAVVDGYQGKSLSDSKSMAACAKHFVGYGAAEGGRDYNTTYIPRRALYDTYFPPFKACVEAGIASFMSSFNDNDGEPATGNGWLLNDVLRAEWGFDGMVVSDWGSVGGLVPHGAAASKREAAKTCIVAGCDMDMMSYSYLRNIKNLIDDGELQASVLDDAVRRVLKLKFRLGLFDEPYSRKVEKTAIYSSDVKDVACALAEESTVLLKNDGLLPLGNDVRHIVVTGPMADAPYDQLGTWSLDGDKSCTVTPLAAMREMLPENIRLDYIPVLDYPRDENITDFKRLRKTAKNADVVIAFVGEEQMMSGEAHSLSSLHLQGNQTELLREIAESGTPLVTVVMAGRPLVMDEATCLSSSLLYMWHPGTMGGPAIVNLLWGRACPSAKLPVTFPRNEGQIPMYYNHKHTSHVAKGTEGDLSRVPREKAQSVMGHTSSYLDVPPTPQFPFGFGLTYTKFEIGSPQLESTEVNLDGILKVSVELGNVGKMQGTEVLQFYVSKKSASVTRPIKELKGFVRVTLDSGKKCVVEYEIPVKDLAFCRKDMTWGVERGTYSLMVGNDSEHLKELKFKIM